MYVFIYTPSVSRTNFWRHQRFVLCAPSVYGHKLPQSLRISVIEITVVALKLQISVAAILSVQFLMHAFD